MLTHTTASARNCRAATNGSADPTSIISGATTMNRQPAENTHLRRITRITSGTAKLASRATTPIAV